MRINQTMHQKTQTGRFMDVNLFGNRYRIMFLHVLDVMRDVPVVSLRYIRMGECALVMNGDDVMVAIDARDEMQKVFDDQVCIVVGAVKNGVAVTTMGFIVSDCAEFMGKLTRQYGMDLTPHVPGASTPLREPQGPRIGDRGRPVAE